MGAAKDSMLFEYVENELGADVLEKLQHQSIGGDNNSKGNHHEQLFAVFKLAKYYGENPNDDMEISSQDVGFVDDLTVRNFTQNSKKNYQLKDSKAVYWSNKKGIKPYFKRQVAIDKGFWEVDESDTVLVLARRDVYDRRVKDIPYDIQSHTRCVFFPNPDTVNELLISNEDFRNAIGSLCPWPDQIDKLEVVARQLMGAWATSSRTVRKITEFINIAKEGADPSFFSTSDDEALKLDENIALILDGIDNFVYEIKGGRIAYQAGGLSGLVAFKVGTSEFQKICDEIISQKPTDAMAILAILMGSGEGA